MPVRREPKYLVTPWKHLKQLTSFQANGALSTARSRRRAAAEGWNVMNCLRGKQGGRKWSQTSRSFLQKADGSCNTNFKKTKQREQVMQALEDFVGGNTPILVSSGAFLATKEGNKSVKRFFCAAVACCVFRRVRQPFTGNYSLLFRNSTFSGWRKFARFWSSRSSSGRTR